MSAILVLADTTYRYVGTIRAHLDAFLLVPAQILDYRAAKHVDFDAWDAVIIHYTVVLADLPLDLAERLRASMALKMAFIQDEYRWVDRTARAIKNAGVSVVFTCVDAENLPLVYRQPAMKRVRFVPTLTGYADPRLLAVRTKPFGERAIDVGYRARKLPEWYGQHAMQKWAVADNLVYIAGDRHQLRLDISTNERDRLYGRAWVRFLASCRATIVTESGASVVDHDDGIRTGLRHHGDADGSAAIRAISPRVFEAAALRTLMLIVPGRYDGVLLPGWHGPILQPDMSNVYEIVDLLRNPEGDEVRRYLDRAEQLARAPEYQPEALAREVRRVVRQEHPITVAHEPSLDAARILGAPAVAAAHLRRRGAQLASRHSGRIPAPIRDALRPLASRLLRVP